MHQWSALSSLEFPQLTPTCTSNLPPCCAGITCRLSHVILQERTLILLHCPSTVNSCTKSSSFHSMAAAPQRLRRSFRFQLLQTLPEAWRRDAEQAGSELEPSLSQLSFSSAGWCAVIYDTLSFKPHWLPPHPPHHHLSLTNSLSALVSCHVTCERSVCNYISKQTGKNAFLLNSSFTSSVPVPIFPLWSAHLLIFSLPQRLWS